MAQKKTTAVTKSQAKLPAGMMDDLEADAGAGGEDATTEDMTIPFIRIGQKTSGETNKRDAAYIDGLEVGDFYNTATQRTWSGEEGLHFVPVYYVRKYLEWTPLKDGGGFQGEHSADILEQTTKDGSKDLLPNGNEIVTTATWYVLTVNPKTGDVEQAVLAFASTQLKKSRQLMTKLKSVTLRGEKGTFNPPFFYNVVKATTVPEQNDQGDWMGWHLTLDGNVFDLPDGESIYTAAKGLLHAVKSGEVKAATPEAPEASDTASEDDEEIPF